MNRDLLTIDCKGKKLGTLIQDVASMLRGTDSLGYRPTSALECGVREIRLLNADLLNIGDPYRKFASHSRFGGGFKRVFYSDLIANNPKILIKRSIKGQLPRNRSSLELLRRVKVYRSNE